MNPEAQPGRKARVLVVDDNVDTARGTYRLLTLLGYGVARTHRPKVILIDIGLPGMSGYDVVASRLR